MKLLYTMQSHGSGVPWIAIAPYPPEHRISRVEVRLNEGKNTNRCLMSAPHAIKIAIYFLVIQTCDVTFVYISWC